ncbi:MAG TPA: hypothetical protein VKB93_00575 [Thermoanaerobaculia bacterium]|nr:hypothetical protein [Thermoanaerobaculia bacterium]
MNVAIVFAPDFSERLQRLAFHTPVWLMETPENRAAAEEAWMRAQEWPHIAITLFRPEEEWRALLAQIAIQHAVDSVEVIGTGLVEDARNALREGGFLKFDRTAEGFRARKT